MSYRGTAALALVVLVGGCSRVSSPPNAENGKETAYHEAAVAVDDQPSGGATPEPGSVATEGGGLEAIMQLVQQRQLEKALAAAHSTAKAEPTNRQVRSLVIQLHQAIAAEKLQIRGEVAANQHFLASAEAARAFATELAPLDDEEELPLLVNAIYNEACVMAKKRQVADAIKSLDEAIQFGFDNLEQLDGDKDFSAIRSDEKFKAWRETAPERITAQLKKKAVEHLAAHKPFDFDFALADPSGKTHKLADLKGKIVLVDVWGTWCPPCRLEIPHLIEVHKKYREKGVEVVGLNYEGGTPEENVATVDAFVKDHGVTYPCLLGDDTTKDQIPDFQGFPTILFLDRSGKVRLKHVGYTPLAGLEAVIDTLLAEDPAEK